MWRWYLCLQAQHHKIAKDIQQIQTNNVQLIYHCGQEQIISDEVEKGRFWQNTDLWPTYYPDDSIYCAYSTFGLILLKVLQFSSQNAK